MSLSSGIISKDFISFPFHYLEEYNYTIIVIRHYHMLKIIKLSINIHFKNHHIFVSQNEEQTNENLVDWHPKWTDNKYKVVFHWNLSVIAISVKFLFFIRSIEIEWNFWTNFKILLNISSKKKKTEEIYCYVICKITGKFLF